VYNDEINLLGVKTSKHHKEKYEQYEGLPDYCHNWSSYAVFHISYISSRTSRL